MSGETQKKLEVHLHVSNSGVTIGVTDEGHGPEIVLSAGAFGNLNFEYRVKTDVLSLQEIAAMFTKAAAYEGYSETYCIPARSPASRMSRTRHAVTTESGVVETDESDDVVDGE